MIGGRHLPLATLTDTNLQSYITVCSVIVTFNTSGLEVTGVSITNKIHSELSVTARYVRTG